MALRRERYLYEIFKNRGQLEKADGKKCCAVYNTLGVTVWSARAKGDPLKIMFSALGGEEVCHGDATSTR
jgi:hypothetical protein